MVLTTKAGRAFVAFLMLASVVSLSSVTAQAASTNAAPKADPNATLTIGGASSTGITKWDPVSDTAIASNIPHYALLYDRLFRFTPQGSEVVPMLATSYKFDSTVTQLTLTLRKGVKFDDGTPFNASVVVANLQRARTASGTQASMANITDVTAVDDSTVLIKQSVADPTTVFLLAYGAGLMMNPKMFSDPTKLATGQAADGTGPYKLASVDATLTYTYDRKANYWDGDTTRPAHIVVKNIVDETTRLNALKTGQLDYTYNTPLTYESLKTDKSVKITTYSGYSTFSIMMNDKVAPFNNPEVRKAISLGIDRAAVNAGLSGLCTPSNQIVPPGVPGHDDSLKIAHNVAKAKDMIQKAGASGTNSSMTELNVDPHMTITTILQAQLAQLGLNFTLDKVPGTLARATFRAGTDPTLATTALPQFPDPVSWIDNYAFGVENPGTKNYPELKTMLEAARPKPLGSKARASAFEEISRYLAENPIWVPVCSVTNTYDANSKVLNMDKLELAHQSQATIYSDLRIAKTK